MQHLSISEKEAAFRMHIHIYSDSLKLMAMHHGTLV